MPEDIESKPSGDVYADFIEAVILRLEKSMRVELDSLKSEFLEKARAYEEEKLAALGEEYRLRYEKEIETLQTDLENSQRVVNIQAALLARMIEENKNSVLKVLENAELSEDDLVLLSGDTRMKPERH